MQNGIANNLNPAPNQYNLNPNAWIEHIKDISKKGEQPYKLCLTTERRNYKKEGKNMSAVINQYFKFLWCLNGTFGEYVDTESNFDLAQVNDFETLIKQIKKDFKRRL